METQRHRELKRIGAGWLLSRGFLAVAPEVTAPIPRFRLDVAGYGEGEFDANGERNRQPQTVVIECKQARSDFIRDSRRTDRLLRERRLLEQRCAFLEETHVRHHEPHLRQSGSSLFSEMEEWDFANSRLTSYRESMDRLTRIDQALYGETKFCTMARYRLADHLYVLAPPGVLTRRELPAGWGLILCPPELLKGRPVPMAELVDLLAANALKVHEASWPPSSTRYRKRFIRNIAIAASRELYRRDEADIGEFQMSLPGFGGR